MANNKELALWRFENLKSKDIVMMGLSTTGLGENADIIEVSIVDSNQNILFDSLIDTSVPIDRDAFFVNGLSLEDLEGKPMFSDVADKIVETIKGKIVCFYGAGYGIRLFRQSSEAHNTVNPVNYMADVFCIQESYKDYKGEDYCPKGNSPYISLLAAAKEEGVEYAKGKKRRSLSDAMIMSRLLNQLGGN
ncbi:hypothetical protein [Gudongella sp. DL1XJH-153]|uniref:3'-5' exonuclease n=1 Tax=Gudongella sp. DL1XJH-153 TaxID=3409804 RepID=UPI003BB8160A